MPAQTPPVLQYLETSPARARHVKMNDELVNDLLQQRQIPAATADCFDLLRRERFGPQAVAVGCSQIFAFCVRSFPIRLLIGTEPPFDAIGIITAGIHPKHNRRTGVKELSGGDNFIALSRSNFAGSMHRAATRANENCKQARQRKTAPGKSEAGG